MDYWGQPVRDEHEKVAECVCLLEKATCFEMGPEDLWVTLRHLILDVRKTVEWHLTREEETLFAALIRLLGKEARAVRMLQDQHRQIRQGLAYLLRLHRDGNPLDPREVRDAAEGLATLLREHEKVEDRLLLDVLEYSLEPQELMALADQFPRVGAPA